jgi:hypothetical protein
MLDEQKKTGDGEEAEKGQPDPPRRRGTRRRKLV